MRLITLLAQLDLSPLPRVGADGDGSPIQTILTIFWALIGAICLLIITISGFRFVLSQGEPQSVSKAKNAIIYAAVGLAVSITATAIVGFVFKSV